MMAATMLKTLRASIARSFVPADGGAAHAPMPTPGLRAYRLYAIVAALVILCLGGVFGMVMRRSETEAITEN